MVRNMHGNGVSEHPHKESGQGITCVCMYHSQQPSEDEATLIGSFFLNRVSSQMCINMNYFVPRVGPTIVSMARNTFNGIHKGDDHP